MSIIKTVKAYETADGKVFTKIQDAEKHQAALDFEKWYEDDDHEIPGGPYEGCSVSASSVLEWLYDHRDMVAKVLQLNE